MKNQQDSLLIFSIAQLAPFRIKKQSWDEILLLEEESGMLVNNI